VDFLQLSGRVFTSAPLLLKHVINPTTDCGQRILEDCDFVIARHITSGQLELFLRWCQQAVSMNGETDAYKLLFDRAKFLLSCCLIHGRTISKHQ
jgi:hypothetical protein